MKRLIVGCGYLGCRVASQWLSRGESVHVLTRSHQRAVALAARGLRPLVGDVTEPETFPALPQVDTLLWAVGYDRRSDRSISEVYVDGLRTVLDRVAPGTGRVIVISSTGVYGQQDGSWVDEASPCEPQRAGGKACLAAEQELRCSAWSDRAVILRLAGIYGPQRLPRLKQLLSGEPLNADPDTVLNLIHVDDATTAILHVADAALNLPQTYLIADGHPVARREFYRELSRQARTPPPVYIDGPTGDHAVSRSGSHKRVANVRMVNELGVRLRYPTYRQGLAAIAEQGLPGDG